METKAKAKYPTSLTTRRVNHSARNATKTLRNNARLSAHTRKFLGNVRNAAQHENIPKKYIQFLRRTVNQELRNRKTTATKQFYKNYEKYAVEK